MAVAAVDGGGLAYGLCACTGAAVMLTLIQLIWHGFKFESSKLSRLIKYTLALLLASYILTGFSVILLVLHRDLNSIALCKTGGFLLIFSTQETLWLLVVLSILLVLWSRRGTEQDKAAAILTKSWSFPAFAVSLVGMSLILGIISSLPLTDSHIFESLSELYYICTPIRLPGESGWGFSLLILLLNWAAVVVISTCLGLAFRFASRLSTPAHYQSQIPRTTKLPRGTARFLTVKLWSTLCVSALCWIIMLLLLNVNYFSGGSVLDRYTVQWILGYLLSITILLQPVTLFLVSMVTGKRWFSTWMAKLSVEKSPLYQRLPRKLESVQKMESEQQGVCRYRVSWLEGQSRTSGVLKVFHPSVNGRWQMESSAVRSLGPHPNLLPYLWESHDNRFLAEIRALTGDTHSPHSSLLCHALLPHGSLSDFLSSQAERLTDIGLHKLSLDVARGLDYLHHRGIVHNNLHARSVLMASVSDKHGLKVVLGGFEKCYYVSEKLSQCQALDGTGSLFSISTIDSTTSTNTVFSADIHAFGLLLLEMMTAMSNHRQTRGKGSSMTQAQHSATNDLRGAESPPSAFTLIAKEEEGVDMEEVILHEEHHTDHQHTDHQHTNHHHTDYHMDHHPKDQSIDPHTDHHHTDHGKSCSCSKKVTEIRVCVEESEGMDPGEIRVIDRDRMHQIQARKLPPIPLTNTTAFRQPVKESNGAEAGDDSTSEHSPNSTSPEHSPSNTLSSSEKSCESEEHYNASSIGSLGSFDTIYEDEEQKSFHSGLSGGTAARTGARRWSAKPGGTGKRKVPVPPVAPSQSRDVGGGGGSWQKKKRPHSGASYDDSVLSSDSGVGSSHYDVESGVVTNHPGSRNTIYSSESLDGDRFSVLMSYLGGNGESGTNEEHLDGSTVISQHSAPAEVSTSDESTSTAQGFEEFSLPDLRIRKKPCRGDHPHFENGPCCHLPPVQSSKPPVPQKPNFRRNPPRTIKKPMPLPPTLPPVLPPSEQTQHDPIYEKIPTPRIPQMPAEYHSPEDRHLVDMATNTGDSLKKNKTGKTQDDEGISLDVVSLVSMVQGLTDKPKSIKKNSATKTSNQSKISGLQVSQGSQRLEQHGKVSHRSRESESQDSKSFISVASSQTSDCCSKCGSNLGGTNLAATPSTLRLSMSSRASSVLSTAPRHAATPAQPKLGVSAYSATASAQRHRRRSNASLGSHAASLTAASSLASLSIASGSMAGLRTKQGHEAAQHTATHQRTTSHGSLTSTASASANLHRKPPLQPHAKRSSTSTRKKSSAHTRSQVKQAVHSIKQKGNLGYTAGQLLPLLAECCGDGPSAPSTEQILQRLQQVLPTASV